MLPSTGKTTSVSLAASAFAVNEQDITVSFTYQYARPAITADCIIFKQTEEDLEVLLIQRGNEPFKGMWAFPGGFAEVGECLEETARRELEEETGLTNIPLLQLQAFSNPDRDPREHVITVAYYAVIDVEKQKITAASDASAVDWVSVSALPELAFDHKEILCYALNHIEKGNLLKT